MVEPPIITDNATSTVAGALAGAVPTSNCKSELKDNQSTGGFVDKTAWTSAFALRYAYSGRLNNCNAGILQIATVGSV